MSYIEFSVYRKRGKHAGEFQAKISEKDKDLLNLTSWYVNKSNRSNYLLRKTRVNGKSKTTAMHRLILEDMIGRPLKKGEYADHINGDGLDNRRENLRVVDKFQNQANRRNQINNKTGYKGVSWNAKDKRYKTQIRVKGKRIYLGEYLTAEEAYKVYCDAMIKYHGEFARLE